MTGKLSTMMSSRNITVGPCHSAAFPGLPFDLSDFFRIEVELCCAHDSFRLLRTSRAHDRARDRVVPQSPGDCYFSRAAAVALADLPQSLHELEIP